MIENSCLDCRYYSSRAGNDDELMECKWIPFNSEILPDWLFNSFYNGGLKDTGVIADTRPFVNCTGYSKSK